ncbi:hypothetical protein BHQ19_33855 [Mycolicibacterium porcinum]|nr:hypothetical protein BHQ19_33855 [Mycolicibacterium porcinum]
MLNASVSRASSSLPTTGIGLRSSVRATRSAASVSLPTGLSPALATAPPAMAATATPTPPTMSNTVPSRLSTWTVGARLLEISRELPLARCTASTRWWLAVRRDISSSPEMTSFSGLPSGSICPC